MFAKMWYIHGRFYTYLKKSSMQVEFTALNLVDLGLLFFLQIFKEKIELVFCKIQYHTHLSSERKSDKST